MLPSLLEKNKWKSLRCYFLYHLVHTGEKEDTALSGCTKVSSSMGTLESLLTWWAVRKGYDNLYYSCHRIWELVMCSHIDVAHNVTQPTIILWHWLEHALLYVESYAYYTLMYVYIYTYTSPPHTHILKNAVRKTRKVKFQPHKRLSKW